MIPENSSQTYQAFWQIRPIFFIISLQNQLFNIWHVLVDTDKLTMCDILSDLYLYKVQQIPKLKSFASHLAVVFAQSIEARC